MKTTTALAVCMATIVVLLVAPPSLLHAQRAAPGITVHDTLSLAGLQQDAVQHDARSREVALLAAQSALKQADIGATILPAVSAIANAQYQSQVIRIPLTLPSGAAIPSPSHETYDAHVTVQQPIYDPTISARRGVERAQLAASQAGVRTALFALRQNVNDAYFNALLTQQQIAEQRAAIADLDAQRRVAAERVRQGTALASEADLLEAESIRHRQAADQLAASRDASLAIMSDLTGRVVTDASALATPDLGNEVTRVRMALDTLRARPEYERFALDRAVLERQRASLSASGLPRISAFGRAGYGRPGLDPLADSFSHYWLAGVQVDWSPWNWGTTRRDRDALAIQQQIVKSDADAFRQSVERVVTRNLAQIDQLQRTLKDDDAIIALRERILKETGFRFHEGVVTSADYVNRETDLLTAHLDRVSHRVQLAQASAAFLTTLGLDPQP